MCVCVCVCTSRRAKAVLVLLKKEVELCKLQADIREQVCCECVCVYVCVCVCVRTPDLRRLLAIQFPALTLDISRWARANALPYSYCSPVSPQWPCLHVFAVRSLGCNLKRRTVFVY